MYGYEFTYSDKYRYCASYINRIYELNAVLEGTRFEIDTLLPEFHSRMECDHNNNRDLDEKAVIIIGFQPKGDLVETAALAKELETLVTTDERFKKFLLKEKPDFYCGIQWEIELEEED